MEQRPLDAGWVDPFNTGGLAQFREGNSPTVLGLTHQFKLLTGLGMAASLVLTTIAPTYAQSQSGQSGSEAGTGQGGQPTQQASTPPPAPLLTAWSAGPGAQGSSTYVGRVET